ncbi:Chitinase 2 [Saitoella coloradoensis]
MFAQLFAITTVLLGAVTAFDASANNNNIVYWGQASAGSQSSLATYCADPSIDAIVLSFLTTFFGTNDLPELNFAGACAGSVGDGLTCSDIAADIQTCQSNGKAVLLSLGGAIGTYGFDSDAQAASFADSMWSTFGPSTTSSTYRPFGSAVIDGFDLDIEQGSSNGYAAFVTQMRKNYESDTSKQYLISGAPQCVYPDEWLGDALDNAWFDLVLVQFYNNPCRVGTSSFNFDSWQNWATSTSVNPDAKVYVGVPASSAAAGSGYVDPATLATIISSVKSQSAFGGVMMWDVSQAWANTGSDGLNYCQAAKAALGDSTAARASASAAVSSVVVEASSIASLLDATTAAGSATVQQTTLATSYVVPASSATVEASSIAYILPSDTYTSSIITITTTYPTPSSTTTTTSASAVETAGLTGTPLAVALNTLYSALSPSSPCDSSLDTQTCLSDGSFAQCVGGVWVAHACPTGTSCWALPAGEGVVVACDTEEDALSRLGLSVSVEKRDGGRRRGHVHHKRA